MAAQINSRSTLNSQVDANFDNPPVVETALSVQFSGITWQAVQFGQMFERYLKTDFHRFSQLAELPPIVETFPIQPRVSSINFVERPPSARGMFHAADESHLIQIQQNRFGFNWKQSDEDKSYPRFHANLARFLDEFDRFLAFCDEEGIGTPTPTFAEVVYVNRIDANEGESITAAMDDAFAGLSLNDELTPELVSLNRTFVLGEKEGRLYAEAGIVVDQKPFISFKLTSRLRRNDESLADLMKRAHDYLIEGFLTLTNESCRKRRWGQR